MRPPQDFVAPYLACPRTCQRKSYTYKHPGAQILMEISNPRSLLTAFGRAAIRLPAPGAGISAGLQSQGASDPVRPAPTVRRGAASVHFAPKCESTGLLCKPWGSANGVSPPLPCVSEPPGLSVSSSSSSPPLLCTWVSLSPRRSALPGASLRRGRSSRNGTGGVSAAVGGREQAGTGLISPPALSFGEPPAHLPTARLAPRVPEVSRGLRSLPKIRLQLRGLRAKQARSSLPKKKNKTPKNRRS